MNKRLFQRLAESVARHSEISPSREFHDPKAVLKALAG